MPSYGRGSPATVFYEAPLRCTKCGVTINKKPKAKTPKYCPPCRQEQQQAFRNAARTSRR